MNNQLRIYETDITSDEGRQIHLTYDEEGDVLEVLFPGAKATCAVELTPNILLRFDYGSGQAAGITLLDFLLLTGYTEMGSKSFPLTGLDDLPREMHQMVAEIITSPPVSRILRVSRLYQSPDRQIPIVSVEPLPFLVPA
ncbi:MAG: DUF2283 domain-containing protein [Chloroflexota bacterium]|nr:DUF2283 domain-containing protein [Chloroflexota bacterium]